MRVPIGSRGRERRTRLVEPDRTGQEILANRKGDVTIPAMRIVTEHVDVKRIRAEAGMSQTEFAEAFCINVRALQEWEQGRRKPDATTRAYLAVIARNRVAVLKALAS